MGDDVVIEDVFPEDFRCHSNVRARAECGADTPTPSVRQTHAVRVSSPRYAGESSHLNTSSQFLAEHHITEVVVLASAGALIFVRSRQLHGATQCQRKRLLHAFSQQIALRAEIQIAKLVARPCVTHKGPVVGQTGIRALRRLKQWTRIPVDAGDDSKRAENLHSWTGADSRRDWKIRYVGQSLSEIELGAVGADRPASGPHDFGGGNEPQARVTPIRRGRHALGFGFHPRLRLRLPLGLSLP